MELTDDGYYVRECDEKFDQKYDGQEAHDDYPFVEAKGCPGYIHARCWLAFEFENTVHDSCGRITYRPQQSSRIRHLGARAGKRKCLHCDESLVEE